MQHKVNPAKWLRFLQGRKAKQKGKTRQIKPRPRRGSVPLVETVRQTFLALLFPLHRVLVLLQLPLCQVTERVGGKGASVLLVLVDESLIKKNKKQNPNTGHYNRKSHRWSSSTLGSIACLIGWWASDSLSGSLLVSGWTAADSCSSTLIQPHICWTFLYSFLEEKRLTRPFCSITDSWHFFLGTIICQSQKFNFTDFSSNTRPFSLNFCINSLYFGFWHSTLLHKVFWLLSLEPAAGSDEARHIVEDAELKHLFGDAQSGLLLFPGP